MVRAINPLNCFVFPYDQDHHKVKYTPSQSQATLKEVAVKTSHELAHCHMDSAADSDKQPKMLKESSGEAVIYANTAVAVKASCSKVDRSY